MIDHGRQAPTLEAYQVHVGSMRASSRGWLKLASKDPRQHPLIDPNYLDSEQDRWALGGRGTYVVFVCLYNGKLRRETSLRKDASTAFFSSTEHFKDLC